MDNGQKIPTPSVVFSQKRYTALRGPENVLTEGATGIMVAGEDAIYGPYAVVKILGKGADGLVSAIVVKGNSARIESKPKTKAELEAENRDLMARLAKLEAASGE